MIRKRGAGSGPFLMEMVVVAGFFMICATVCVTVFAKADRISRQAWDINHAVEKAQSLAEEARAVFMADSLEAGRKLHWSEMLPDRDIWEYVPPYLDGRSQEQDDWLGGLLDSGGYQGMYTVYWDKDWQQQEPSPSPPYLGVIFQGKVDGMERLDVSIMRYGNNSNKGEVLYRLQTEIYVAPKEADGIENQE